VIAAVAGDSVAYLGSRCYTWPGHRSTTGHRVLVFIAVSVAAAAVQLGCLWLSHDIIGWTGAVADNLSTNVVGMALATALRFWGFRLVAFHAPAAGSVPKGAQPIGTGAQ